MIKHLFKMVWNRKRWNLLILLEIFLSFLVLFAIATVAITLFNYQRKPIGFDYQDVWQLTLSSPTGSMAADKVETTFDLFRQIETTLKNQTAIRSSAMINTPPYMGSSWSSSIKVNNKEINTHLTFTGLGLAETLDLEVSEGRWFRESDFIQQTVKPVVINRNLANMLFENESPIGKRVTDEDDDEKIEFEIIGVIDHFRKEGELKKPRNFGFLPLVLEEDIWLPRYCLLEMNDLDNPAFEEQLIKELEGVAPNWSFKINPMQQTRNTYVMDQTRNIKIMGLIAFFLLLMVAMGLIGVLWQHVTRRTVELGVRRAKGATRRKIYQQIIGEFLVIATIALGLGLLLVIQIPLFGLFKNTATGVMVSSFFTAGLAIYLLTIVASLYPGWLATRIMPAEALHYE